MIAGIAAKQIAQPVAATDINSGVYYHAVDPFAANFVLWADGRSLASTENVIGLRGDARGSFQGLYAIGGNNNGTGVRGDGLGNGIGVEAYGAGSGYGVYARGGGAGVYGTGSTYGVYASGTTYGVSAGGVHRRVCLGWLLRPLCLRGDGRLRILRE